MARRNVSRREMLSAALPAGVALAALTARTSSADYQPRMEAARIALRTAEGELKAADNDKGGHRAKALELVQRAIAQVDMGIKFANRH